MLKKIAIVLVVLGVLGVDGGVRAPETLGEKIEESIEGEYARTAFWGVYAQDLDAGRLLYSRNEEKTLIPASNQKLLTTATALDVLGSAYRWTLGLPVSDPTA
ncbi:MAG: D-alanyl-D-alanine carboxypeptidase, partial [Bacteroidetes bacterium]|nr:D-alanyl-D-alanine carboxypeptidase [Bacteroidota bacterium]